MKKINKILLLTVLISILALQTHPVINAAVSIKNPVLDPLLGDSTVSPTGPAGIIAILLARFFSALLAVGTVFFMIMFAINAFRWMTAGGDSGKIQQARQGLLDALLGITVLASIFGVANLIAPLLGLSPEGCNFPTEICWPTFGP